MIDIDLEAMETALKRRLSRFKGHPDWDDAIQEGLIHAWNDSQSDKAYGFGDILNRSGWWAKNYIIPQRHSKIPTGGTHRDRSGTVRAAGEVSREKIKQWMQNYRDLHGTEPTLTQTAKGIGMHLSTVSIHVKKMKQLNFIPQLEDGTNTLDYRKYTTTPIDGFGDQEGSTSLEAKYLRVPGFEEDLLNEESFQTALNPLPEEHRRLMTLHYVYGYPLRQVDTILNKGTGWGARNHSAALKTLRAVTV